MKAVVIDHEEGALSGAVKLADFAAEQSVALTRFAYLLCGDHQLAEDLVQDAFVGLYRRFGETMAIDSPVAYARRVIVKRAHLAGPQTREHRDDHRRGTGVHRACSGLGRAGRDVAGAGRAA